jgi:hypothetical protein
MHELSRKWGGWGRKYRNLFFLLHDRSLSFHLHLGLGDAAMTLSFNVPWEFYSIMLDSLGVHRMTGIVLLRID